MNATNGSRGDDDVGRRMMNITLMGIGAGAILMNAFVILIIMSFKSMRSNANIIILSMAVADLLSGAATIIVGIVKWSDWFRIRAPICEIIFAMDVWAGNGSLAHVLAVNLERYLAIVYPLKYKSIVTLRRLQVALVIIWILSLAEATGYTFGFIFDETCIVAGIFRPGLAFGISILSIGFPLVTVVGIYIHIVVVVIRKLRFMTESSNVDEAELARSQRKMFVIVSVILAAWIICWLPLMCMIMVFTVMYIEAFGFKVNVAKSQTVLLYVEIMSYCNSLLNPILYFLISNDFRKAGLTLLFKCRRDEPSTDVTPAPAEESARVHPQL